MRSLHCCVCELKVAAAAAAATAAAAAAAAVGQCCICAGAALLWPADQLCGG
jgi:hypothetical protein